MAFRLSLAMIVATAALLYGTSSAAHAQTTDELRVSTSTMYEPQPDLQQIAVSASYTLTNLQPDEVVGGRVRSYYYTKWVIVVPASVTNLTAASSQQELTTTIDVDADTKDVVFVSIELPSRLNYQQTVQIDVTYTVPGGDPRAGTATARVNDSFLSFSVWAAGDPGLADVRVRVPAGFIVDLQGDLDEFRQILTGDETLLEATSIARPQDFFGQVFGRNDRGLITEIARLPAGSATVRAWPDDPEWATFVVDAIENDVPVLAELTGLDWTAGDIEVIETVTPYLYGYGGWFNASSGLIEVGETLERDLILHELAHAWFNDELIDGRWITEGMAEEFASRTIEATGDLRPDPTEPDLADPLRVPLADWGSPWARNEEDAFAYEQYHYNASWWVIRQITDAIGLDAFADVLQALRDDVLPYPGEQPGEYTLQPTRWTNLFDLLDTRADQTNFDELFANYVLDSQATAQLEPRREALAQYHDLVRATGTWSPPLVVRRDMTAWRFETAKTLIAEANSIVATRDATDALAASLDIDVVHESEMAYEAAASMADLRAVASTEQQVHTELEALRDARAEIVARGSELGVDIAFAARTSHQAAAEVDDLRTSLEQVATRRDHVEEKAVAMGLDVPDWSLPALADTAAATSVAQARLATLEAIERATVTVNSPRSFMQQVGLWRRNPAQALDQARHAFETDALDQALASTAIAEITIADAASNGQTRVWWASATVTAVIAIAMLLTWLRRRNKFGAISGETAPGSAALNR